VVSITVIALGQPQEGQVFQMILRLPLLAIIHINITHILTLLNMRADDSVVFAKTHPTTSRQTLGCTTQNSLEQKGKAKTPFDRHVIQVEEKSQWPTPSFWPR